MTPKEYIREKDQKIFDLLYEFKIATIDDICDLVFNGKSKQHLYKRLKDLRILGHIAKIPHQKNGRSLSAYSLTKKSFLEFICKDKKNSVRQEFRSGKVKHDLSILQIYKRLILSEKVHSFLPENILTSDSSALSSLDLSQWIKNNPDGLIIEKSSSDQFYLPLEVELSAKGNFRYEKKLLGYYQCSKIPAILYVCDCQSLIDTICRIEKKYCKTYHPKIFYGLLDQFQKKSEPLIFYNRNNDKLIF